MSQQRLKDLNDQLKQNITALNVDFNNNHQTLWAQVQELKNISAKLRSSADVIEMNKTQLKNILTHFRNTISPLTARLQTISTNINQLQQIGERFSAADKTNLGIISAPDNTGEAATDAAATVNVVHNITGTITSLEEDLSGTNLSSDEKKAESQRFIQQMSAAVQQFQETLGEIKHARDQLNSAVERNNSAVEHKCSCVIL